MFRYVNKVNPSIEEVEADSLADSVVDYPIGKSTLSSGEGKNIEKYRGIMTNLKMSVSKIVSSVLDLQVETMKMFRGNKRKKALRLKPTKSELEVEYSNESGEIPDEEKPNEEIPDEEIPDEEIPDEEDSDSMKSIDRSCKSGSKGSASKGSASKASKVSRSEGSCVSGNKATSIHYIESIKDFRNKLGIISVSRHSLMLDEVIEIEGGIAVERYHTNDEQTKDSQQNIEEKAHITISPQNVAIKDQTKNSEMNDENTMQIKDNNAENQK